MRRRRVRRWAKWAFTLAAGLAVGVAVASRFWWVQYLSLSGDLREIRELHVGGGLLSAQRFTGARPFGPAPHADWRAGRFGAWHWGVPDETVRPGLQWDWRAGILWVRRDDFLAAGMSLLYPVLLTTLPAALLWYTD